MTLSASSPVTWTLALTASLAAHASAAALVAAMLHPDPVPDQPPPQSELRIETQQVAQSKATTQKPTETPANAASAKGSSAAEGVVPASKAQATQPKSDHLAAAKPAALASKAAAAPAAKLLAAAAPPMTKAATPPRPTAIKSIAAPANLAAAVQPTAQPLAAIAAPAPTLTPVAAPANLAATVQPATQSLAAIAAPAPKLTPVAAPASLAAAVQPATQPLAAVTAPTPVSKPTSAPATALASTAPDAAPAAEAAPNLQPAASAPADGDHMTASLAWTGADAQLDPASLKAIQSFMQPGDTAAQADETHDALSAILSSVPCSRLQAEFNPATGSLDLRGHVPDAAMKGPILAALQAQLGTGIKVNDAMLILPRPQCGALSGIADVGLPQSQDQNTNPRLIGADAQARAYDYTRGQTLVLDLAAPDYDAYVYVDYFAADGTVIHLVPNDTVPLKLRAAKSTLRVGAADAAEPFLNITIGPPYGQEIATAFAASAPLYDGTRPLTEPAAAYLDWLKTRVTAARAKHPNFKGEWVYFFVSTKDKG